MTFNYGDRPLLQPDGRMLLLGEKTIFRLLPNGSLDPSFGDGGVAVVNPTFPIDFVISMALLPDGKILLLGRRILGYTPFVVTRLLSDGKPDLSFGTNGSVKFQFDSATADARHIAIASDGTALFPFRLRYAPPDTFKLPFKFVRFTSPGNFDPSIGVNGVGALPNFNADSLLPSFSYVRVTNDDKVIFHFQEKEDWVERSVLYKMDFNGQLDTTFGNSGKVIFKFSVADLITDIAIQPDNKIIVAGSTRLADGTEVFLLARFNPDGALDSTFGVNGKVLDKISLYDNRFGGVAVQDDGKIIAVGSALVGPNIDLVSRWRVIRYRANGTRDAMFGSNGVVATDFGDTKSQAISVLIASDKGIYVGGKANIGGKEKKVIAKYLPSTVVRTNDLAGYDLQARVFPNPSSGQSLSVRYFIEKEGLVSLTLFNALGQVVSSLPEKLWQISGQQEYTWNLSRELSWGTYYVRLETPDGIATLPLLVYPR